MTSAAYSGAATLRGFTYLGMLVALAIIGIGLARIGEIWSTEAHRQRVVQVKWAGQQYARAIASYRALSPGMEAFPSSLDELLDDSRGPVVRRHLRVRFPNPLDPAGAWVELRGGDGKIRGVRAVGRGEAFDFVEPDVTSQASGLHPDMTAFSSGSPPGAGVQRLFSSAR